MEDETEQEAGVTSLKERRRLDAMAREGREALAQLVERTLDELFSTAVPAAMFGPWRAWSDAQPEGAIVNVSTKALAETDDPAIAAVGRALLALEEAHFHLGGARPAMR